MRAPLTCAALATVVLLGCNPQSSSATPDDAAGDDSLGPADPIEEAAQKIAEHKPDEALAIVEEALVADPDNHELWFSKGVALREAGDTKGALEAWDQTLRREPDYFAALHARGAVFLELGQWAPAIEALNAAAAAKSDFADVHYNLALALLGAQAEGATDLDYDAAATSALTTAHRIDPKDVDVALELAALHLRRGRLADAEPLLVDAVAAAPKEARVHAALGRLRLKQGNGAAALEAFDAALAIAPDDASFELGHAQALLRLDRSADAEAALAELSKRAPDSAVVWLEWGTALAKQGKLAPALEKMEVALQRAPHLISAQVRRIGLLSDLRKCKAAKNALATLKASTQSAEAWKVAEKAVAGCKR